MSMNLWFSGYGLWQQWQEAHAYEQPILTSEDTFGCPTCGKVFTTKRSWKNHNAVHQGESLVCRLCGKQQSSRTNYTRHLKTQHGVDNTYQAVDETRDVDQVWNKLVRLFLWSDLKQKKHSQPSSNNPSSCPRILWLWPSRGRAGLLLRVSPNLQEPGQSYPPHGSAQGGDHMQGLWQSAEQGGKP